MADPTYNIINGDCLEVMSTMADRSVDAIITDPPYEENVHRNQIRLAKNSDGSISAVKTKSFELGFSPMDQDLRVALAKEFVRLSKGWILIFCQNEAVGDWKRALEYTHGIYKRAAIWIKPNAQPQMSGDRPANGFESIVCGYAVPEKSIWNGGGKVGIYHARHDALRFHPTQKPVELMSQLVTDFTQVTDLVLDPFSGSGSTGVACKKLARQFIGIEQNVSFCEVAKNRLLYTNVTIDATRFGYPAPKQQSFCWEGGIRGEPEEPCQEPRQGN